jgi:hypothetical protein
MLERVISGGQTGVDPAGCEEVEAVSRIELYGCSVEMVGPDPLPPIRLRLYQFGPLDPDEDLPPDYTGLARLTVEAPGDVELVTQASGDRFAYDRRDGSYASAQHVAILSRNGAKGYRVVSEESV